MSLPVAILAGGLATRLRPITDSVPKALIEVAGKPFALHQIELLRAHGISRVVWLVGYRGNQIEAALGDGSQWGMRFDYVHDGQVLLGTGGAICQALPLLDDVFFVMYGDSYLECDFADVEHAFRTSGSKGLMTVYRNEGLYDKSNIEFSNGRIISYDKRAQSPSMHHIDWGLGVLDHRAVLPYPSSQPLDLMRVYQDLLAAGELAGYEVSNRFYEVGSPQGIADADAYLSGRMR